MIFPPRFGDVSQRMSVLPVENVTTMGAVGLTHLPHLNLFKIRRRDEESTKMSRG